MCNVCSEEKLYFLFYLLLFKQQWPVNPIFFHYVHQLVSIWVCLLFGAKQSYVTENHSKSESLVK